MNVQSMFVCRPPQFDFHTILKDHRKKERKRLEKQNRLLQGHVAPPAQRTNWRAFLQDPEEFKDLTLTILEDYDTLESSGDVDTT